MRAPAKINLWLKILGTRADGYHLLHSVFVPVTLFDEMEINPARAGSVDEVEYLDSSGHDLRFEGDTVSEVLSLFQKNDFFKVRIQKKIPVGAGLGGGSSDAAALLKYLCQKYKVDPSSPAIKDLALKVGADVPFFMQNKGALVEGIGEKVTPMATDKLFLVISKPPFSVNSKEAYGWFDEDSALTRRSVGATQCPSLGSVKLGLQDIVKFLDNDLEKPVEARHPEIARLKKALLGCGALGSQMSGSGSSVFGIFDSAAKSEAAKKELEKEFPSNYVFFSCQTLD